MEANIKLIKEKCIEANPEIMELKFGCYINPSVDSVWYVLHELVGGYVNAIEIVQDEEHLVYGAKTRIFPKEILGRPIRLADILIAIEKVKLGDVYYSIRTGGEIIKGNIETSYEEEVSFWNLRTDNLDQQSPECIEFLENLLK